MYSVKFWNEDELIGEIGLMGKRYSKKLLTEAKRKALISKYWGFNHTCIDLCKNGDAYVNLYIKR